MMPEDHQLCSGQNKLGEWETSSVVVCIVEQGLGFIQEGTPQNPSDECITHGNKVPLPVKK